jgi:hypothetical protein
MLEVRYRRRKNRYYNKIRRLSLLAVLNSKTNTIGTVSPSLDSPRPNLIMYVRKQSDLSRSHASRAGGLPDATLHARFPSAVLRNLDRENPDALELHSPR